jgi:RNA polymerase sigma factor (sigma-70 family)
MDYYELEKALKELCSNLKARYPGTDFEDIEDAVCHAVEMWLTFINTSGNIPNDMEDWLTKKARKNIERAIQRHNRFINTDFQEHFDQDEEEPLINIQIPGDTPNIDNIIDFEILLSSLDWKDEQTLHLYYKEEMNFKEIGEKLGKSEDNIRQRHKRAIAKLKNKFPDERNHF